MKYQFFIHFENDIFLLNQVRGKNFITEDFADFCSKKSFITIAQLFLCKWLFQI